MAGFLQTLAPSFRDRTPAGPSRSRAPARAHPRRPHVTLTDSPAPPPLLPTDLPIHRANLRVSPLPIGWFRRPAAPPGTVPHRAREDAAGGGGVGGGRGDRGDRGDGSEWGGREGGGRPVQCRTAIGFGEALRQQPTLGTAHAIGWRALPRFPPATARTHVPRRLCAPAPRPRGAGRGRRWLAPECETAC